MRYAVFLQGIVFFGLILSEYGIHMCFHDVLLFFNISDLRSKSSSLWKLQKRQRQLTLCYLNAEQIPEIQ